MLEIRDLTKVYTTKGVSVRALALELQGKSKDRARVQEILRQVELEQFARRKPNTLSGGQKQRVAIARALVKNPEIIMADEPTGALDSKTGKQVFDTLKKLSGGKLVIVVSHDREFAEVYGDRIIELKDGKVISAVCFVLSVIASIVVCGVLNNVLAADLGASIFVFGPLSVLAMLGIAAVTSFLATVLPVYGIAKKKPVESIRAL